MNTTSSRFGRSVAAKATVLFVAFLFLINPLVPVFAAEGTSAPPASTDTSAPTSAVPEDTGTPAEEVTPPPAPADEVGDVLPPEEEKEPVDKEKLPPPPAPNLVLPIGSTAGVVEATKARLSLDVDNLTGALVYKYNIVVPPGRNDMTPNVNLIYNSANASRDSVIGSGWEIDIPSIERVNKTGTNNLYSASYYASSMEGELLSLGSGLYGAKNDNGDFLKYSLASNVWTVTDKKGTVYKFGTNAVERQDNSADTSKVYKWMLQEVRDTNDNYVKYEYYKDAGQIYPSKITYTGNGSTDGPFTVNFVRTSRTNAPKSFSTGFSVQSNYRITEIRTEVSTVWARKYTIAYTTGDNGDGSLLDTITEAGQDDSSVTTTLPAVNMGYATAATDWTYNSTWNLPMPFTSSGTDYGMRTGDINGDGLVDLLCHTNKSSGNCSRTDARIYLNNGSGWATQSTTWDFPAMVDNGSWKEAFLDDSSQDQGLRVLDVNGDLKADLVRGNASAKYTYINNGSTGWTYTSGWNLPIPFANGNYDSGMRMADINGDGLPDILCHNDITTSKNTGGHCNRSNPRIYLNNGSGWTDASSTWSFPAMVDNGSLTEGFLDDDGLEKGMRIFDVNGDGLADLIRSKGSTRYTYINNGGGWTYDSTWNLSDPFVVGVNDSGLRNADINGDGLVDILCHNDNTGGGTCDKTHPIIKLNNGHGWTDATSTWVMPTKQYSSPDTETFLDSGLQDNGVRVLDINGDGIDDVVNGYSTSMKYSYLNNEDTQSDKLTDIVHAQGGTTTVTYKAAQQYKDGSNNLLNPAMPIVSDLVSQISNSDGLGLTASNNYDYEGGSYYFNTSTDRKFAGFSKVTKTDSASNKTVNYFHQGNSTDSSNGEYSDHISKAGKIYRTEIKDSSGNIYAKTVSKWDKYLIGTDHNFVKLVQTIDFSYDGDSDHKDKATAYAYSDTTGNLTQKIDWGEVTGADAGTFTDTGSDKLTTDISYAFNTTPYIIGLPSQDTTTDQSAAKVKENKYYYDGQTLGNVTDGNLTKQEMWKTSSTYTDIEKTYNTTYGIVTQEKDQRDKATNYSYDSYNLYPATVTNPLSQATSYTYDYSSGQIKQATDPNTRVYQTLYDGLDRATAVKQPDLASPGTLLNKTAYTYTDTSGSVKVQKTDYLDGSTSVDSYTYFDGLGRAVQSRTEIEDGNYAVTDTIYNNIGQVNKESIPYSSSGSSKTSATTTTALLITYSYDPLLRVTSTVNAAGTTSNAYDDWKLTVTDPRSKVKDLYKDAYGNLIRVDEHNSGSTYTTNYEYNGNNKLTKITDALSNVRNFTYDGLGRRLTAQDLHASADATFGSYTYTYDDSGNLTSVVDPKSQTINYTYDDINRVATEDYTGLAGTEVTYTYDAGTDGKGKLTSVAATGANTTYAYDANGNRKQEVETINATGYQTDYTYDRQGNQLELTNPDSSKVKYAYNTAGQLETVQRKESTDGAFINLVTDFDYGVHGKITYQAFQNGAATTNTYDSAKLYRLSNRTTTITGGSKMQDLTYTYDNNGNITKIVDASNTNSSKTVTYGYDDLNRLTSAVATLVASGQSTYSHSYTYDAIGNILTRTDAAGTYSYAGSGGSLYANPHAVTSIGSINYTYDNNGNMLTETSGLSNTWDYNNRLTQAVKGGVTSTYAYDQSGQRVKLSNGTTTTYYPSQSYNTDGTNPVKHITTPNGEVVATVKGTGASAAVYYDHADHLTGSNVMTNSSGGQEELMDYFPYGNIRLDQKAGTFDEQRKAFGQEFDADTSLSYMEARYYHSAIGRFISEDPAFLNLEFDLSDPQSLNSYAYARNNPLRYIDPDGEAFRDYINGIAGYGVGLAQGVGRSAVGLGNAAMHPVQTLNNTGALLANGASAGRQLAGDFYNRPGQTLGEIKSGIGLSYAELEAKSAYEQGKAVGNVFGQIEASVAVSAGIGKAVSSLKYESIAPNGSTLSPGPFAGESIPAAGPGRNFTAAQRNAVNAIGNSTGCHTCGSTIPGTKSGNFVLDHQPVSSLNFGNARQSLFPQCLSCSLKQGGQAASFLSKLFGRK